MPPSTALETARQADHALRVNRAQRRLAAWEVVRVGMLLAAIACMPLAVIHSQPLLFASFFNWRDVHPDDPRHWLFAVAVVVLLGVRRVTACCEAAARERLASEVGGVLPERWIVLRNVSGVGLLLAMPLLMLGAWMLAYRPSGAQSRAQARLWRSVEARDLSGARAALDEGAVINGRHINGVSPLARAVNSGDHESVTILLRLGADPLYHSRYPPLFTAVDLKKQRMVALMLPYVDRRKSPYSLAELSVMAGDVAAMRRELRMAGVTIPGPGLLDLAEEWGTTAQLKRALDPGR